MNSRWRDSRTIVEFPETNHFETVPVVRKQPSPTRPKSLDRKSIEELT